MALRLRRGTDAERLLITPVEGELIYTTDTKLLYVGDGSTAGGTLVTGAGGGGSATLEGLTDTSVANPNDNDVLQWSTGLNKWIAGSGLALDSTIGELSNVGLTADTASHQDFLLYNYDNAQWQNTDITDYDFKINIIGNDSTILVNTDTNTFHGKLNGDVYSGLTLVLDSAARVYTGNVNGNVIGTHTGPVIGDVTGSVFADNSTLLVDGVNGEIVGDVNALFVDGNTVTGGDIRIGGAVQNAISTINPATTNLLINTSNSAGEVVIAKPLRIGGTSSGFDNYGFLNIYNEVVNTNAISIFHNSENTGSVTATIAKSRGTKLAPTIVTSGDTLGAFQAQGYNGCAYRNAGGMAVIANGTPGAAYVPAKVSLYTAASNGVPTAQFTVDGNGTGAFRGAAQLAVYADNTARDAAITSPAAGMMVFNTTLTKFQGYTGAAWVDLN